METQLQEFTNTEFGTIRAITLDGDPWFVGKDVATRLGYKNTKDALERHVDEEDKRPGVVIPDPSQTRYATAINESGLYSLILSSKLPSAKRFKRWITSEVIPAIRRTGGYIPVGDEDDEATIMAKALRISQRTLEQKEKLIAEMTPKALFADAVSASQTDILIGELAKILKANGVETGQKRLFDWLRNHGYLIRGNRSDHNMPTQRAMELGLFRIKETTHTHADGHITISKTPKVTGKGQQYFINMFIGQEPTRA